MTALNPAPRKTSNESEQIGSKRSQEEPQSWSDSLSGLLAESCDQQNHPVPNLMTADTPLDKVTSTIHLTPLLESALPDTSTVCQETSNLEENLAPLPSQSAQVVERAATYQGATTATTNSSPEKGASGVFSAPISASVRDIVASKEEEGLMISGLEEVNSLRHLQQIKLIQEHPF